MRAVADRDVRVQPHGEHGVAPRDGDGHVGRLVLPAAPDHLSGQLASELPSSAYLLTYLPACLLACLPTYLPTT